MLIALIAYIVIVGLSFGALMVTAREMADDQEPAPGTAVIVLMSLAWPITILVGLGAKIMGLE